jgi:triacylglycerol lipase
MKNKRSIQEVLPEITWERLAPPYLDYHYFQGAKTQPFRPQAQGFDMVNAWWLIEASTLAYADLDYVSEKFQGAGLPEVKFFSGSSTQCYVAANEGFLILVFRGTEIRRRAPESDFANIIEDLVADAKIALVDSGQGGKVHRGFKTALDEVWENEGLLDYLRTKDDGRRTFWFTGHSLGAALATLAAGRYGRVRGLYTYGSPRVGDGNFKAAFTIPTYRFVNHDDFVTQVPLPLFYRHVGDLKYIDGEGLLHANPNPREAANILTILAAFADAFIPSALVEHVPLLYATHIWNNIP